MHRTVAPAALLAASLLVLVGCTPGGSPSPSPTSAAPDETAAPEPTRPALEELALGPDGFEQLPLGEAPATDPELALVSYDAAACDGTGVWNADPSYPATGEFYGPGTAFTVTDFGTGSITRIDLNSADIPTDEGVRFGSTRADVEAAYPDATVDDQGLTDVYVVSGAVGTLQIEVAKDESTGYWEADRVDTVQYIHASTTDQGVFSVAASGNVLGVCQA